MCGNNELTPEDTRKWVTLKNLDFDKSHHCEYYITPEDGLYGAKIEINVEYAYGVRAYLLHGDSVN